MDTRDKVVPAGEYGARSDKAAPETGTEAIDNTAPQAGAQASSEAPALAFTADEPAQDVGGEVGKSGFSLKSLNPMNLRNIDFKNLKLNRWQIAAVAAGGVAVTAGIAGLVYWRVQSKPKSTLEKLSHRIGIDKIDLSAASPRRLTHMAKSGLQHLPMPSKHQMKKARAIFH